MSDTTPVSLDERALTEAAKALHEHKRELAEHRGDPWIEVDFDSTTGYSRQMAMKEVQPIIAAYLAALPGPPLDEWLKEQHDAAKDARDGTTDALQRNLFHGRWQAYGRVLEALAEDRKATQ